MKRSHWKTVKLGEVCRIVPGFAFSSKDWSQQGIPVLKIKNIVGDTTVDLSFVDHVARELLTPRLESVFDCVMATLLSR